MDSAYAVQAAHREGILDRIREEERRRGVVPAHVEPLLDWIDANMAGKRTETVVSQFFEGVK